MYQQATLKETPSFPGNAVNELFAEHYGVFLRTAHRILHSKEDAEDAVQTAYCAAFRNVNRFRGESSFKTWITRIVVNCCLMQLRTRRVRTHLAFDDLQRPPSSRAATPESLCYLRELQSAAARAASRLPKRLKDVYDPCLMADVALPTVAHRLGLTTNAAKSRLFRARRRVEQSVQSVIQGRTAR